MLFGVGAILGRSAPFATSYMVGREDKRTNNRTMLPTLKNNTAAGYESPVKIELLKGARLLFSFAQLGPVVRKPINTYPRLKVN